jgi:excisionase family DNA binding protein
MKHPATKRQRERRAAKRAAADTVTVDDVAARLGIGRNQAYAAVQEGKIPSIKIGRRWLVPRAALDRLLSSGLAVATA